MEEGLFIIFMHFAVFCGMWLTMKIMATIVIPEDRVKFILFWHNQIIYRITSIFTARDKTEFYYMVIKGLDLWAIHDIKESNKVLNDFKEMFLSKNG